MFGVHVRQLRLDELVVSDWGGELVPGVGVGEDEVESGAHDAAVCIREGGAVRLERRSVYEPEGAGAQY